MAQVFQSLTRILESLHRSFEGARPITNVYELAALVIINHTLPTEKSLMAKAKKNHRLIILTQWFDPEPTFKGLLFARAMKGLGFDIEVVTGFPNYPGGKVYPGYRIKLFQREMVDGIIITRLPLYPSHDHSAAGRVANYVSFFLSAFVYLTLFARRADILYVYHPPLTVSLAAVCAKIFRQTLTVIDIQDMWPDTLRATGMVRSAFILKIVDVVCRWVYRFVDQIVVLSPGFRKLLLDRSVPSEKINVIYNWADENALAPTNVVTPKMLDRPDRFRVLFAGNMGKAQALDNVLDAAKLVASRRNDVDFIFLGGGLEANRLKTRAALEKISNALFIPKVPMAEVRHYLAASDCALVHLRADPLFSITIPSKTQAYMAAGKPIIMAVEGDAAELVARSGCGILVPPEKPGELADAVCALAAKTTGERHKMAQAATHFYSSHLCLAVGTEHFSHIFLKLIKNSRIK